MAKINCKYRGKGSDFDSVGNDLRQDKEYCGNPEKILNELSWHHMDRDDIECVADGTSLVKSKFYMLLPKGKYICADCHYCEAPKKSAKKSTKSK